MMFGLRLKVACTPDRLVVKTYRSTEIGWTRFGLSVRRMMRRERLRMHRMITVGVPRLANGIHWGDGTSLIAFSGRYWWMYCVDASRCVELFGSDSALPDFD